MMMWPIEDNEGRGIGASVQVPAGTRVFEIMSPYVRVDSNNQLDNYLSYGYNYKPRAILLTIHEFGHSRNGCSGRRPARRHRCRAAEVALELPHRAHQGPAGVPGVRHRADPAGLDQLLLARGRVRRRLGLHHGPARRPGGRARVRRGCGRSRPARRARASYAARGAAERLGRLRRRADARPRGAAAPPQAGLTLPGQ